MPGSPDDRLVTGRERNPLSLQLVGSQDILLQLGRLAAASAYVENELESILIHFLDASFGTGGELMVVDMDFRRKTNMVKAFMNEYTPTNECYTEIANIMDEVHDLYNQRNEFIHGIWERSPIEHRRKLRRASVKGGKLRATLRDVAPEDIQKVADRLIRCAHRIDEALIRSLL